MANGTTEATAPIFKYERIYVLTQTINPTTRATRRRHLNACRRIPKSPTDSTGPPRREAWPHPRHQSRKTTAGIGSSKMPAATMTIRKSWTPPPPSAKPPTQPPSKPRPPSTSMSAPVLRAHVPAILYGVTDNYLARREPAQCLFYFPPGGKGSPSSHGISISSAQGSRQRLPDQRQDLGKFIADPSTNGSTTATCWTC